MKKLICLSLLLGLALIGLAQNQQGYVKTKGRMVSGKYYAGKPINGATVQVKGGGVFISRSDGTFLFPVSGKSFNLQKVQKQGYVLLDQDLLYRQFAYSSNPLEIVMEDKAQLEADRRALERQVRRVTDEELRRRGEEIEALKEQNKITEERYRELLNKLNNDYDQNEQLIKDMVERYNKIDFDQLDEFNRRVSDCIINGRLDEADSLLRTKGDIDKLIGELNKHHESNVKARVTLEKSEAYEQHNRKNLAQLCHDRHLVFKMRHQFDSAAIYIEKRIQLDSNKIEWICDAANFYDNYLGDCNKALHLYQLALKIAEQSGNKLNIAHVNDKIGTLLTNYDRGAEGLKYILWGQKMRMEELDKHHHDVAVGYGNIAYVYAEMENYDSATVYFKSAIDILKNNKDTNNSDYIQILHNYSNSKYNQGDIDEALNLFERRLQLNQSFYSDSSMEIANFYNDYGMILDEVGSFEKSLELHNKALSIRKNIYGENNLATSACYTNIGKVYSSLGKYDSALIYYKKALDISQKIVGLNNSIVARAYNNMGVAYSNLNDYDASLKYHRKALMIRNKVLGDKHSHTATSYNNIGFTFWRMGQLDSALTNHQKALAIRIAALGDKHPDVAMSYSNIGAVYLYSNDYQKALLNLEKALEIDRAVYGENSLDVAGSYNGIAQTYEKMGKNQKAKEYYEKSIAILEQYFSDDHPVLLDIKSRLSNVSKNK